MLQVLGSIHSTKKKKKEKQRKNYTYKILVPGLRRDHSVREPHS
jgi:hypothetical protein